MAEAGVTIRTWAGEEARSLAGVVCGLYEVLFREPPLNGSEREFANQRGYYPRLTSRPGFRLTTARAGDGDYVGFGYGHLLPADTSWWDGLDEPVPAEMTRETGQRTFAVIDYGVVPAWQGKGIARAIHDELLGGSGAERATLTVRPTATATLRGSASEVAAAVRSILDEYLPG